MSKDNDDSDNDKYNLAKHKHKTIASSNGWKLAPLTGAVHMRQCQIRARFESRGMQFFMALKKWL